MTQAHLTLLLEPAAPDALDDGELDELTRALARQLEDPDLTTALSLPTTDLEPLLSPGTKGLGQGLGKLMLEVAPKALPALLEALRSILLRDRRVRAKIVKDGNSIELDFDPSAMNGEDLAKLVARVGKLL